MILDKEDEDRRSTGRKRGSQSVAASSPTPSSTEGAPTVASGTEAHNHRLAAVIDLEDKSKDSKETEDEAVGPPAGKKPKKSTSPVREHYTKFDKWVEVNGEKVKEEWVKCKYCKYEARRNSRNGTIVFLNHTRTHNVHPGQQQLRMEKKDANAASIETYRYDQEVSLRKFYLAIIMHEYPFNLVEREYFVDFIKSLRPTFPMKSRTTIRKDIHNIFLEEWKKLYEHLKTVNARFSATMDMWTSNQNKGYMCITIHWIDDNWSIQKRIIKFMHVKGRHTGVNLADTLTSCLHKWFIEKKMFSLTLDNAAANDVCVKDVIDVLNKKSPLICDGSFFHVKCANHILNLVARDGLAKIGHAVMNIRSFVLLVKCSPLQMEEFLKCASECELDTKRGLSLDVATRWNSTYHMLSYAIYYRAAFERLYEIEKKKYESFAPLNEDWDKATTLCTCLKIFYDVTKLFSGTLYPTANLFYRYFCEIKSQISEWRKSNDQTIKDMANSMYKKFDKYWKRSNLALAVAYFLDPRYRKKAVEYRMKRLYGVVYLAPLEQFMSIVREMYEEYANNASKAAAESVPSASVETNTSAGFDDEDADFQRYMYASRVSSTSNTSDLDKYLAEDPLYLPGGEQFDVLAWWKAHKDVYPVLSLLARDVLAMQVSTVASESAFSSGGCVIDPFRSRLEPEIVEALICTKDWIAAAKRDSNKRLESILNDLEVAETMLANLTLEDLNEMEEQPSSDEDD